MRRKEFDIDDPAAFNFISGQAEVGYLGVITTDGYPRVIPVNFASEGRIIYFHGASAGEKFDLLQKSPKVTFSIDITYSFIPSHWFSKENGCNATMFYKSALVKGVGRVVSGEAEKIAGLNLLMEKYQPEGGYLPMDESLDIYRKVIKATALYKIEPDEISVKINFRRKSSKEYNLNLIDKLRERGTPVDLKTAAEIEKLIEGK